MADVNAKADALRESTAKIVETGQKLAHLTTQLNDFGAKQAESIGGQSAKVASTSAELVDLGLKVNSALSDLDTRLESAVSHCKTSALADVETMRVELRTWFVGVKTEIQQLADAIRGGGGGGGVQTRLHEGKGSGGGIDKKVLPVWKLPEDISKVQFRHWVNAIDIQLEAIHGW